MYRNLSKKIQTYPCRKKEKPKVKRFTAII